MQELWLAFLSVWEALQSGEPFMIARAIRHPVLYWILAFGILPASFLVLAVLRAVPVLNRHLEPTAMFFTYMSIAAIIFVEVIRRFFLSVQAPWSTTLPPYLFLLLTWIGCAYNVKLRSHLAFGEVRAALPPAARLAMSFVDAALWYLMAVIVMVATLRLTANSASNFQLLLGTDNVMRWWFYICVPAAWLVLYARVLENLIEDVRNHRVRQEPSADAELARE
ncbi:TRAP transporter small permease [Faunimonas sp. B44]|uniref:TRAP transporter small permease n=1 Tax=Faunimonas sp. B44 TaxID=3461493 RepID=UPI004043C630